MTFLCSWIGLWLLVRLRVGISAGDGWHQIKWERSGTGISALAIWLPVVRWGCIVVGISAGYS